MKVFKLDRGEQITSHICYHAIKQEQVEVVTEELCEAIQEEYQKAEERKRLAVERASLFSEQESLLFPDAASESLPDEVASSSESIEEKLNSLFGEEKIAEPVDKDGFAVPEPQHKLLDFRKGDFARPSEAYEEFFPFASDEIKEIVQDQEFEARVKQRFESEEAKEEDQAYVARKRELYKPKP